MLRILVVDDSPDDCELAQHALQRDGVNAALVRVSSLEALEVALAADRWDLAFVDWRVPQVAPDAAIRRLTSAGVPVLVVSGSLEHDSVTEALQLGACDYVQKGDYHRLAHVVRRELSFWFAPPESFPREEPVPDNALERAAADFLRLPDLALAILDALPVAILAVGADGRVKFCNHEAQLLSGYHKSELLGRPVELLVPEEARAQHEQEFRPRYTLHPRQRPMGLGRALRLRHKSGNTSPVDIMLQPLPTASEGLLTVVTVRSLEIV